MSAALPHSNAPRNSRAFRNSRAVRDSNPRRDQNGYAILIVLCITTLLLIASMSVALSVRTEGQREKEQEMIWRGNQYVRGVKLYYRKFGRFPTSLDDLLKPSAGNIRFMRQAYKDPMNKEDGSWRLIYVGPAGQLIGSLKPHTTGIQMPVAAGQQPAGGASALGFGSQPPAPGGILSGGLTATPPNGAAPGPGQTAQGATPTGSNPGSGTSSDFGSSLHFDDDSSAAANPGAACTDAHGYLIPETPTIMGGGIIGVGSRVNQSSVIVYDKATKYCLYEFVWDPSKDLGLAMPAPGAPLGTNPPSTGGFGTTPPGGQPNGVPPLSNPPQSPNQNPNPQQQQ
ncbi:MAG TPA: hypothetical protein VJN93_05060 [Candidatus Acidoferrum sp.]|nr:hypothetical protein [Candidatus Acidoferrum sp.]